MGKHETRARRERSARARAMIAQILDRKHSHQCPAANGATSRVWDSLNISPQALDRMLRKEAKQ